MEYSREGLEALAFVNAPSLHPDFQDYEAELARSAEPGLPEGLEERRKAYAQKCRELCLQMMAEGSRDFDLGQGVDKTWLTVKADSDGYDIPVMQLDLAENKEQDPEAVIIYVHGGGLAVGEADSEELTCRRMLKAGVGRMRLYSVGYRLKDPHDATTCIKDVEPVLYHFGLTASKTILVGSSSGGQIAATLAQKDAKRLPRGVVHGVLLRGPVTADACSGRENIPERFRDFHTSVNDSFINSMSFYLKRRVPRDGLPTLPLEGDPEIFRVHARTWIQVSTNDTLYSDGLCYAMALQEAGAEVKLDVIHGWPHTFWLVAPALDRSLEAEEDMIEGLKWLVG